MSECFGLKTGSMRPVIDLLEPLLEVRFKKVVIPSLGLPWYIALSKDKREHLVLFPNETKDGRPIDPAQEIYELVLYLVRSYREEKITRTLSTESQFRFLRPTQRFEEFAKPILKSLE